MTAKRIVTVLAVLLVMQLIVDQRFEGAIPRAVAADNNPGFVPLVKDTPEAQPTSSYSLTPPQSQSEGKDAQPTATAWRRPASSRLTKVENTASAKTAAIAGVISRVLPWAAGVLILIGLGMVVYYLRSRFQVPSNQVARSITQIRISDAGWGKQRTARVRLASRMAHTESLPSEDLLGDQEKEAEHEERRAA